MAENSHWRSTVNYSRIKKKSILDKSHDTAGFQNKKRTEIFKAARDRRHITTKVG